MCPKKGERVPLSASKWWSCIKLLREKEALLFCLEFLTPKEGQEGQSERGGVVAAQRGMIDVQKKKRLPVRRLIETILLHSHPPISSLIC